MSVLSSALVDEIKARRSIRDKDVDRLDAALRGACDLGADDIDALFALNAACPIQTPLWPAFFIDIACGYAISQMAPHGYLTTDNAAWLIARVAPVGQITRRTEFELMICALERARWAPSSLAAFALEQIKLAVLLGDGPIRATSRAEVNTVSSQEVILLRRILQASGGAEGFAMSRAECEVLFDIDEATERGSNHPDWDDLFVKAIANVVMSASGYRVSHRREALIAHDAYVDIAADGDRPLPGAARGLARVFPAYRPMTPDQQAIARLERQRREIVTGERESDGSFHWLAERLTRNGKPTKNISALAAFLHREGPAIHPVLKGCITTTPRAA